MSETLTLRLKVKEALITLYNLISDRIELLSEEWQRKLAKLFTEILKYDEEAIVNSNCHKDLLRVLTDLYNILLKGKYSDQELTNIEHQLCEVTERLKQRIDKRLNLTLNTSRITAALMSILFLVSFGITLVIIHGSVHDTIKAITLSAHALSVLFFIGLTYQFSLSKGNITRGYIYMLVPYMILVLFLSAVIELLYLSKAIAFSFIFLGIAAQLLILMVLIVITYRSLVLDRVREIYVELKIPTRKKESIDFSTVLNSDEWQKLNEEYKRIYGESGLEILKYEINVLIKKGLTLNEIYNILQRRISSYIRAGRDK